jgi:hypothetical protein
METILGFVAGYLVGTRDGKDGLERMRKLAANAITLVEGAVRQRSGRSGIGGAVGSVTDMLVRRAAGAREGRAA